MLILKPTWSGFREPEGNSLVISKGLYALRSWKTRYLDRFADALRKMNFFPYKKDPDLWLWDMGDHYECVCVYVDDLMMMSKDPGTF